jgi:RNA polymerase sigma-32 factor
MQFGKFSPRKNASRQSLAALEEHFYLSQLRDKNPLSREYLHDLLVEYQICEDDRRYKQIRKIIIESHLRIVIAICTEYHQRNPQHDFFDLVQEGNLGMLKALGKYDPHNESKASFSTYCVWWIRARINNFLIQNKKLVRIGTTQSQRKIYHNYHKTLHKRMGDWEGESLEIVNRDVAKTLGVDYHVMMDTVRRMKPGSEIGFNSPTNRNNTLPLSETLEVFSPNPEQCVVSKQHHLQLQDFCSDFRDSLVSERHLYIWDHRLVSDEPLTLDAIGKKFGVTRERARQLEAEVVKYFKKAVLKKPELIPFPHRMSA